MELGNFETRISGVILQRGRDYFKQGHVVELFGITDTNWQAEVEGTDTYVVDVKLNEAGEIVVSNCDCPFDSESYCKHEVAVFYALQGAYNERRIKGTKQEKPTLQQLLEAKKKDELIELIVNMASKNTYIYKRLLFEVSQQEGEIESVEEVIRHHISMAMNRGYIEWNKVSDALEGVYIALERVKANLENEQYEMAMDLSFICLNHLLELLNVADDSSGDIGGEIEESLACIEEAIGEGVANWSHKEKETIFAKIVEEALSKKFIGWTEHRFELLTACLHFCAEGKFEKKLNTLLESMLEQTASDSWSDQFDRKQIKEIQFQLVLQKKDEDAIEGFLFDNLTNYNMREKAVLYSFEKKEYEKALQLSLEGEQVDKALPGIVRMWKDYQYKSYEYLGDKQAMKKITFSMVLKGNPIYYEKIKLLYLENEWKKAVNELLLGFDDKQYYPAVYLSLLIDENITERLLVYCQKDQSSILTYYKYLVTDYSAEVKTIFDDYIRKKAQVATNRKAYQQVCEIIIRFQQACGQNSAVLLIGELKKEYGKRPAFLDELGKI